MSQLALPILAFTTFIGYLMSKNDEKMTDLDNVEARATISPNEIPNGENVYSSNRSQEVDAYVLETAQAMYKKAENPTETGIIPPLFNTYGTKGVTDNNAYAINASQQAQINNLTKLSNVTEKPKVVIEKRPMFTNPEQSFDASIPRYREVYDKYDTTKSLLTGLPLDTQHNNMVPFFGSVPKQNTSVSSNVPLIETFTGRNDTYQRKSAVKLTKEEPQNIHGNPVFSEFIDTSRYIPSTFKQGEAPDRTYVAAPISGTLENNIRPGFKNVDELRVLSNPKETYEGRTRGHAARYTTRGISGKNEKRRPETFYEKTPDHLFKTTGSHIGTTSRENFMFKDTSRQHQHEEYFGIQTDTIKKTTTRNQPAQQQPDAISDGIDNSEVLYSLVSETKKRQIGIDNDFHMRNVGFTPQVHDYGKISYDLLETERDSTGETKYASNVHLYNNGLRTRFSDQAKTTVKETTVMKNHVGPVSTRIAQGGKASTFAAGMSKFDPKVTQRESSLQEYTGIAKNQVENHAVYSTYDKPVKMRVAAHVEDYLGNAASSVSNQSTRTNYKNAEIDDKHERLIMGERASGPQIFQISASKNIVNGSVKENTLLSEKRDVRDKLNPDLPQQIPSTTIFSPIDQSTNGKVTIVEKENNRLNEVETMQLKNNPFHNQGPQLL